MEPRCPHRLRSGYPIEHPCAWRVHECRSIPVSGAAPVFQNLWSKALAIVVDVQAKLAVVEKNLGINVARICVLKTIS